MTTDQDIQIYQCPHCDNKATIKRLKVATIPEEVEAFDGEHFTIEYYATLYQCMTCQNVLLVITGEMDDTPGDISKGVIAYPEQKKLPNFVPEAIRTSYQEAKKVEKISPTAFAVMIRRALEYLCKDQSATGKTLNQQLEDLASRKIIPQVLAEMTDVLRTLGNIGAHANETIISKEHTEAIKDFYNALVEYVYIAPYKLKKLKESLSKNESTKKVNK